MITETINKSVRGFARDFVFCGMPLLTKNEYNTSAKNFVEFRVWDAVRDYVEYSVKDFIYQSIKEMNNE
jgi:hypothetical protein